MEDIVCRAMTVQDLNVHMMDEFDRHQEVTLVMRKNGRVKKLRRSKVEGWPAGTKESFVRNLFIHAVHLRQYYHGQPLVFAAFRDGQVVAFASRRLQNPEKPELSQLDNLFVSRCRRMGLGRQLFRLCAEAAKAEGAQVMLVNTRPAFETQAFYRSLGCAPANKRLRGEARGTPREDIVMAYTL